MKIYAGCLRCVDFSERKPNTSVPGSHATLRCAILTSKPLVIHSIRFFPVHLVSFINFLKFLINPDCPMLPLRINKNLLSTFRYLFKYLIWSWSLLSFAIQHRKYQMILHEMMRSIDFKARRAIIVILSTAKHRPKELIQ